MCSLSSNGMVRNLRLDRVTALIGGAFLVPLGMMESVALGSIVAYRLQNAEEAVR